VDGGKILVYVESRGVEPEIPASIEGFPTQVVVTGNIEI